MAMNDEELKGYRRGYAKGREFVARTHEKELASYRDAEFQRQVFLAVLPSLIRVSTWSNGDKKWSTIDEFVDGAWKFARKAANGTHFTGVNFNKVVGDD